MIIPNIWENKSNVPVTTNLIVKQQQKGESIGENPYVFLEAAVTTVTTAPVWPFQSSSARCLGVRTEGARLGR